MLAPNTLLQNRYLIVRPIGRGGMGAVYEAVDTRLQHTVALKQTLLVEPALRRAFEREARLLARLRHPVLPKVTDHFLEGDGQFLVMEYIPGDDLAALLVRNGGKFPAADVLTWGLRWADQLLDALEYLHSQVPPVVHRDIKPQNLKLTSRGDIILLDFGLAKGGMAQLSTVTARDQTNIEGYTPSYAPLEQIRNAEPDPRSDLYSLAATLYHVLTGVRPPDALQRAAALLNDRDDPLRPANEFNPQLSISIAAVLHSAMSPNPGSRPASASVMRKALRNAQAGLPIAVVTARSEEMARSVLPEQPSEQLVAPLSVALDNVPRGATPAPLAPPAPPASSAPPVPPAFAAPMVAVGGLINALPTGSPVLSIAFSPGGHMLAVGSEDHSVNLLQPDDGQITQALERHPSKVQGLAFSPDGRTLAVGSEDRSIRLWRLDGANPQVLTRITHAIEGICFSPDGQLLAAGGWGSTIGLWEINGNGATKINTFSTSFVHSLTFSPDGQLLAAGCYDGTVRLWKVDSGELLRVLEGHNNFVLSVAFSPDGRTLVSGGGSTAILIWRVADGRLLDTWQKHSNFVRSLAFSPDGQWLASGSEDRTVRVWRVANGMQQHVFDEPGGGVTSVAFRPDGQVLAAGSRDNKVRLWRIA